LCKKYKKAKADFAQATEEHDSLSATISADQLEQWTRAEKHAMENRIDDVSVMDIYDVQQEKGQISGFSVLPERS
jgi:hypothetical protein